ncbi:tyrosine-type recombinase/integrase [Yinghuangia aomiensis]|uniref:Tyrosine-type recombinase/integrase n=1 Tax=Yinghuangia aomiensis TaxID=676205 RepID=A0ABP9IIW5_9ACTN
MKSYKVKIWAIRKNTTSKRPSYQVRWSVDGREFSAVYGTKALAESHRADLVKATRNGEGFDTETGLPDSLMPKPKAVTWYEFAALYVDMKWKDAAAKSRDGMTDALATVLPSLAEEQPTRPSDRVLRRALRYFYLAPASREPGETREVPSDVAKALAWLTKASLPVAAIADPIHGRAALDAITRKLDGTRAGTEMIRRKRAVLANVIGYAIERGELAENPLPKIRWTMPKTVQRLDRRRVANPRQLEELLTAVSYVGGYKRARGRRLVAFFACLYYATMRPAEVVNLKESGCHLPETGWGSLTIEKTKPLAGKQWTDSGESHDDRGLKQRAEGETRVIPIPPVLVAYLRAHLDEFGTATDGRVFGNERGGLVGSSTYDRVWHEARMYALTEPQRESLLAQRPYDLRHAGISFGLRATRDPARIAERAGHSVEVMMTRYSWVLDEHDASANKVMDDALRAYGTDNAPDPQSDG